MSISKNDFNALIKKFNFKSLFNELGWDNFSEVKFIKAGEETFKLEGVVEKKNFTVFVCNSGNDSRIILKDIRKKIDREITKLYHEHLLIYIDKNHTQQLWQLSIKEPNKPVQYKEFEYYSNQEPEILFQKLRNLFFSLDEEDKITLLDVKLRVSEQFNKNAEKVTKKFYQEFKKQHSSFQSFIEGLKNQVDIDWYTSLILNRLMFIYFIQKKGFLDGNTNYLHDKLKETEQRKGKDKFYSSFYKSFLLILFHDGLGKPHDSVLEKLIGKVPYLNGGLFDVHKLEKDNDELNIADDAFEKLFAFFDQYNWHLDVRPNASGNDINPDVIGYIFEKYINDRASMGAYYTKEDITEYISKNTIIPFLFDRVKEKVKNAFAEESSLWKLLRDNPDLYIYDAVKKGVPQEGGLFDDLPDEIKAGFRPELEQEIVTEKTTLYLWEIRKVWNKKAPEEIALPTETYRELIERRKRYSDIKTKIVNGKINEINDFITYNLNIRQFAQDAVEQYEGSDFISVFYNAIKEITILDPTAGSGAFLFAALNILEPLYEACIARMREFVEIDNEKGTGRKHESFRKVLKIIKKHPNEKYYIYKSIILNNLYGVDIMNEAVEIAKLRLFLKLVAVVDTDENHENYGLEPLPDIDFNIRAGNTLVGFATEEELNKGLSWSFDFDNDKDKLHEQMDVVARTFKRYKENQLDEELADFETLRKSKYELRNRLAELNGTLNDYLAKDYGIIHDKEKDGYNQWLSSHKPFHWFAEYYEIINGNGGFDVIIGNPPYLRQSKILYNFNKYNKKISDIYGYIMMRALKLILTNGNFGFIIMHSLAFSRSFSDLRTVLKEDKSDKWFSFFGRIPAGLFSGDVRVRNCIAIINKSNNFLKTHSYTSRMHRWFSNQRNFIFTSIQYSQFKINENIPMYYNSNLVKFYKSQKSELLSSYFNCRSEYRLYFKKTAYNWLSVTNRIPPSYSAEGNEVPQTQISSFTLPDVKTQKVLELLFNGKFFLSFWLTFGDEFHVTQDLFNSFRLPVKKILNEEFEELLELYHQFNLNLDKTVQYKLNAGVKVGSFNTTKLWEITDKSDLIFLKYLTDNVEIVFEDINNHVLKTIMSEIDGNEDIN